MTKKWVTQLGYGIVGCAIEVHRHLGPGLLEEVYEFCLLEELMAEGYEFKHQARMPIPYKGRTLDKRFRMDLLVEDTVIVELKALETVLPVHKAQLLTYMKLAQKPKGILINFFTDNISQSAIHLVNEYYALLPDE